MSAINPIIADLIGRVKACPAPRTTRDGGRIYFAWPDGRSVRWEIAEAGEIIDSGRAYLPGQGGGWTANAATGAIVS